MAQEKQFILQTHSSASLDDIDVQLQLEENDSKDEGANVTQRDVDDAFYVHVTINSVGEQRPNEEPSTIYQLKNVAGKPIDNREKDLDVLCYPDLYPDGQDGMRTFRTFGEETFIAYKMVANIHLALNQHQLVI